MIKTARTPRRTAVRLAPTLARTLVPLAVTAVVNLAVPAGAGAQIPVERMILTASDPAPVDRFGSSVALEGSLLAVGAPGKDDGRGKVYLFSVPAFGEPREIAHLAASDGVALDHFGTSVVIDGDVIAVGAPGDSSQGCIDGAVYLFEKPAEGWADATESARLEVTPPPPGRPPTECRDQLGRALALDGDVLVAGAPGARGTLGGGYVFERPAGGWVDAFEDATLTYSMDEQFTGLGGAVALEGGTLAIAAFGIGDDLQGGVLIFERPVGRWVDATETAVLTPSDAIPDLEHFGDSLAIDGDVVAVGQRGPLLEGFQGAVYLFERPEGGWVTATETAKLQDAQGIAADHFSHSLAFEGERLYVGTPAELIAAPFNPGLGSFYLYDRPPGGWTTGLEATDRIYPSDGVADDGFGLALAVWWGRVAVGRVDYGTVPPTDASGKVYLFEPPMLFGDGFESGDLSAWSVAMP